jgi:hypothetical protein
MSGKTGAQHIVCKDDLLHPVFPHLRQPLIGAVGFRAGGERALEAR